MLDATSRLSWTFTSLIPSRRSRALSWVLRAACWVSRSTSSFCWSLGKSSALTTLLLTKPLMKLVSWLRILEARLLSVFSCSTSLPSFSAWAFIRLNMVSVSPWGFAAETTEPARTIKSIALLI